MMYSQDPDVNTWLNPAMNFQAMQVPYNDVDNPNLHAHLEKWNGIHMNDANVVHLHGTRGAANTLLLQWELWRRITGEEFEFSELSIAEDSAGNLTITQKK